MHSTFARRHLAFHLCIRAACARAESKTATGLCGAGSKEHFHRCVCLFSCVYVCMFVCCGAFS